jgi:hypothetical protein
MATRKFEIPSDIYQIKVTLLGTRPPIWRRLLVPAAMTLGQLHGVIQAAMGWEDCHLHEFRIGQRRFGMPDPLDRSMGLSEALDERKVRLCNVLGKVGAKAVYTYDFGDGWEHSLVVEKLLPPDPTFAYPLCTAGKLSGPPEDCGGIPGYYNMIEALQDPNHEQHEEMLEWVGDDLDPNAFSVELVNRRLAPLRRSMPRS